MLERRLRRSDLVVAIRCHAGLLHAWRQFRGLTSGKSKVFRKMFMVSNLIDLIIVDTFRLLLRTERVNNFETES